MPMDDEPNGTGTPTNAGIRKGDQVRVMTGRDRGKTGRVLCGESQASAR